MVEHGIEDEQTPSNVTVHYNVGPGHPEYDENGHISFAWEELRARRAMRLKKVDIYQGVLVYNTLTEEQQNELATYRQALLDLPSDYDDPFEAMANLPTIPSWLN
tara:strand:+ start:202 stop:516 length:315 start_codon:yes stop_codon:yes gene_type:complete